jgi:hypothetical protein
MESFAAVLTAGLLWLFLRHLVHQRRKRARQLAGPLLRRWTGAYSRGQWIWLSVLGALPILYLGAMWMLLSGLLLPRHMFPFGGLWGIFDTSPLAFMSALFALEMNPIFLRWDGIVELRQRGILLLFGFRAEYLPWPSVEHCQWTKASGRLEVKSGRAKRPAKVRIPRRDMPEATAILSRHVEVRDIQGRVLNPKFSPSERPAEAEPVAPRFRRFQFDLRTLLFFVLVASSAMSWYGIYYRREAEETAALARLQRFGPRSERFGDAVWTLDFSASTVKPGDRDLEAVAKLTRLFWLDLSGAPITDAGLVHVEPLTSLRWLMLSKTAVTDAGLKHLEPLVELRQLDLMDTAVDNAGVAHLEPLTKLESLVLAKTAVTDAGLVHLEPLTGLETLLLSNTAVTDAGLAHLKKLTSLRSLGLEHTRVTKEGVKRLQQALPEAKIYY